MDKVCEAVEERIMGMADEAQARHLMRFFKTGKGQYGEGDMFLGLKVPATRAIVKDFKKEATLEDIPLLVASPYHEIRLAGFLLLIEIYQRAKKQKDSQARREIIGYYLSIIDRGNNWDLVDLVAPKLLGDWLIDHPEERDILDRLAEMDGNLWHQRVAIVATWSIIASGEFDDTFRIALRLLNHPHDLIHKAVGWMLREVGKRGGRHRLLAFLDRHASAMPRTALRYSIEHLSPSLRHHYLTLK